MEIDLMEDDLNDFKIQQLDIIKFEHAEFAQYLNNNYG